MRAGAVRFEVGYPWGLRYCGQLRARLRQLGLATGSDPLVEGSDSDGFFVAENRSALARGRAILGTMTDAEQTDAVLAELHAIGVYEIFQDWKHLEWEVDAATLRRVGVRLRLVSTLKVKERDRLTLQVQRVSRGRSSRKR